MFPHRSKKLPVITTRAIIPSWLCVVLWQDTVLSVSSLPRLRPRNFHRVQISDQLWGPKHNDRSWQLFLLQHSRSQHSLYYKHYNPMIPVIGFQCRQTVSLDYFAQQDTQRSQGDVATLDITHKKPQKVALFSYFTNPHTVVNKMLTKSNPFNFGHVTYHLEWHYTTFRVTFAPAYKIVVNCRFRGSTYGSRAFGHAAPSTWNALPNIFKCSTHSLPTLFSYTVAVCHMQGLW